MIFYAVPLEHSVKDLMTIYADAVELQTLGSDLFEHYLITPAIHVTD